MKIISKLKTYIYKFIVIKFHNDSERIIHCRGCGIVDIRGKSNWKAYSWLGSTHNELKYPVGLKFYCLTCEKKLPKDYKEVKI